jgi:hypothetical protein
MEESLLQQIMSIPKNLHSSKSISTYNNIKNSNPNQFWVFGFKDSDLNGSIYVPQQIPSY